MLLRINTNNVKYCNKEQMYVNHAELWAAVAFQAVITGKVLTYKGRTQDTVLPQSSEIQRMQTLPTNFQTYYEMCKMYSDVDQ